MTSLYNFFPLNFLTFQWKRCEDTMGTKWVIKMGEGEEKSKEAEDVKFIEVSREQ